MQLNSLIAISSFSEKDFNFTITPQNSDFLIKIMTTKAIINGPNLLYNFTLPDLYLSSFYNMEISVKNVSIKMLDFYPMSESDQKTADSANKQNSVGGSIAKGSGYSSTFVSSGSSLFMQGLMLMEMIFLLKFIDINYPTFVKQMFKDNSQSPSFIFQYFFVNDPRDEQIMPALFRYYDISIYFLNNAGEIICGIGIIIFISSIILKIVSFLKNQLQKMILFRKIMIIIQEALVWDFTLLYVLTNLQKIVFLVVCSWIFPPTNTTNALINLSIAILIGLIVLLWFLHLFEKIRVFQRIKNAEKNQINQDNKKEDESKRAIVKTPQISMINSPNELVSSNSLKIEKISPTIFFKDILEEDKIKEISSHKNQGFIFDKTEKLNLFEKMKNLLKRNFLFNFLFNPKEPAVYLKRYEMLHIDYISNKRVNQYYIIMFYLRQCFISLLAVLLYSNPLAQITLINIINVSFIIYTIISKPFVSFYSFIVCIIEELIVEIAFFAAFILCVFDFQNNEDIEKRMFCGWVIIFANLVLLYWVVITATLRPVIMAIHNFWKKKKDLRKVHAVV